MQENWNLTCHKIYELSTQSSCFIIKISLSYFVSILKKASSSPPWFHPLQICWWRSLNPFDIRTRSCQEPPPGLATIAQSHGCLRNRPLSLSKQGDVDSIKSLPNLNWKTNTNLFKSLLDGEQIILNTVDVHMGMSQTEDACDSVRDIPWDAKRAPPRIPSWEEKVKVGISRGGGYPKTYPYVICGVRPSNQQWPPGFLLHMFSGGSLV